MSNAEICPRCKTQTARAGICEQCGYDLAEQILGIIGRVDYATGLQLLDRLKLYQTERKDMSTNKKAPNTSVHHTQKQRRSE